MSKVLEQGETYQDGVTTKTPHPEEGPEKDLTPNNNNRIKMLAIGGVAVLIVLAILLLLATKKSGNAEDAYESSYSESDDYNPASALLATDGANQVDSTAEGVVEEEVYYEPTSSLNFTDDEIVNLRKHGYTGDEIELASANYVSYDSLIEEADALIKAEQQEVLYELSDTGSEAYQTLLNMTWLQGQDLVINELLPDENGNIDIYTETKTMNIDYVKVPSKGSQLWLKCDCREFGVNFLLTDPSRWVQLSDSGNILVEISVTYWGGTPVVTNIVELDAGDREY